MITHTLMGPKIKQILRTSYMDGPQQDGGGDEESGDSDGNKRNRIAKEKRRERERILIDSM